MEHRLQSNPPLPHLHARAPGLRVSILRVFMRLIPNAIKCAMYQSICSLGLRWGWEKHPVFYHLPFGLGVKIADSIDGHNSSTVEAAALHFLESSKIQGIDFPHLIDLTVDEKNEVSYMLSTYIDGDLLAPTLNHFNSEDWARLALDLQLQLRSLREQTDTNHPICGADGGIINDPRISWVAAHRRSVATSPQFFSQVWLGLDLPRNVTTIRPAIQSVIDRPVSVNFCHGDIYPHNIIIPGGLSAWRAGKSRLCFIDWAYSGWMPAPWEVIKATFTECDLDSEWVITIRKALPEFNEHLDADWLWRTKSQMMII